MAIPRWVIVSLFACGLAQAQVTVSAAVDPSSARAGEVVELQLTVDIDSGYHVYAASQGAGGPVATSFEPAEGFPAEVDGGLREPQPHEYFDQGFQFNVLSQSGTVVFTQPLRIPADTAPGVLELDGKLKYQACTDTSCLRPMRADLATTVMVEPGAARPDYQTVPPESGWTVSAKADEPAPDPEQMRGSAAEEARSKGLWTFLLVAFLAGLAALLTPCVWPMVPITVSFFTKQAGDSSRKRIGLAGAYGGGIVVMYTGLGLLLAATLGATGASRIASNPFMNLFFAGLLVFFGLTLFGAVNLSLPSGLVNYANKKGDAGGYVGAMFMGLTLTLAAFTCTVQFVGGVLVWAANGELLWPVLGMLAFSTAFALPFFLLALFPQYLSTLPKSGSWLENSKVVLGIIEIAAAAKFLSNADLVWQWHLLTREVVLSLWSLSSVLIALFLWGKLRVGHAEVPTQVGVKRVAGGALFLLLALYLLWGLTGARLGGVLEALMPPAEYSRDASRQTAEEHWYTDYDEALAQAKASGTNLFLDFTGITCTNCRWMEQNIFTDPDVKEKLSRLTTARLYTDTGDRADEYAAKQVEQYQTASLPFYAIVDPEGRTIATFDGLTKSVAEFAEFLGKGE